MLKRATLASVLLVAIAIGVLVTWARGSEIGPVEGRTNYDPALVARGENLAAIGNCVSCHTAPGGKAYAGGYPVETAFGTIYGTNITPDAETGIGRWSLPAFTRAMREGVRRDGAHLYPAFPYDHFVLLSDGDIGALYAYLMTREPVRAEARRNELPFPLNVRLLLAGWKALYLDRDPFQPDATKDAQWNRGAYLVHGLGHCGACHTPRNVFGAEQRAKFMDGAKLSGWIAPALNARSPAPVPWTLDALHRYLRTGIAEAHPVAAGPMAPVVEGLSSAAEEDVRAISTYITALMGPPDAERRKAAEASLARARDDASIVASPTQRSMSEKVSGDEKLRQGFEIYRGTCALCHDSGRRTTSSGDALHLSLSTAVALSESTNLVRVILQGLAPPHGQPGPIMPGFAGALTDQQIVALASYIRSEFTQQPAWTNVEETLRKARADLAHE